MSSWLIYAPYFFSVKEDHTETHLFADMYAIRILDEGNNHSSPGTASLALAPYKH